MKPNLFKISIFILILAAGLGLVFYTNRNRQVRVASGQEIEKIKATNNRDEQVGWYEKLINRVGPAQAQEELYRSGLPFTGETHLLNHAVGEYLYKEQGVAGLRHCKDYFLASCHHGFVISAIGAGGMDEVKKVIGECRQGGIPVVSQCSHAVGHGFLASEGYKNLTTALKLCDELSITVTDLPIFNCLDGTFMENIWGVHDGAPSPDRWIRQDDWFYPCNDPQIEEKYLAGCWSNQPTLMYQMFGGDIHRVGQECGKVQNPDHRRTCFNGLARQIHPLAGSDVNKVFGMCRLLPPEWINYCLVTIAQSDFSVGGRVVSFEVCAGIEPAAKPECYQSLAGSIATYATTAAQKNEFCNLIKEPEWRQGCY